MALHVVHRAVTAFTEPGLQVPRCLRDVDIGDADAREAQFSGPGTDAFDQLHTVETVRAGILAAI